MDNWYCEIAGRSRGPMGAEQLRELARTGELKEDDQVWREGLSQRVAAHKVGGLFSASSTERATAASPGNPAILPYAPPHAIAATLPEYAEPSLTLPVPNTASAVPVVKADPGPFRKIGGAFSYTDGGLWGGKIIASAQAFYLVKLMKTLPNRAVGGLVGYAIANPTASPHDDTRTCSLSELPENLQHICELRPKKSLVAIHYSTGPDTDIIVLPREAINLVKFAAVNSIIAVHCGGNIFRLQTSYLKGAHKKFLIQNGWIVNQPVETAGMAVHGRSFGRDVAHPPPQKGLSLAKRILLIIVAIVIFILVVLVRMSLQEGLRR